MEPAHAARRAVEQLERAGDPDNAAGMARFGISTAGTLGVPMPVVRDIARDAVRDVDRDPEARHEVALELWRSGLHEARIASALVDVPELVTRDEMERHVLDIDSWDVCDQLCMKLWWRVDDAWTIAEQWAGRPEGFVKRAGFVLMATFAYKRTDLDADSYLPLLELAEREACDDRNEVKKGISWAIRQIGKRDARSNTFAIEAAQRILEDQHECRAARWIARDALRELRSDAVRSRLGLA